MREKGKQVNESMLFYSDKGVRPNDIFESSVGFDGHIVEGTMKMTNYLFSESAAFASQFAFKANKNSWFMILASVVKGKERKVVGKDSVWECKVAYPEYLIAFKK